MLGFLRLKSERRYRRGEIAVGDPEMLTRLRFQGLTEEDLGVVSTWKEVCQGAMDRLAEEFYEKVLGNPATRGILQGNSSVERQRGLLIPYILTLFDGRIDDHYLELRRRVGAVHDDPAAEMKGLVESFALSSDGGLGGDGLLSAEDRREAEEGNGRSRGVVREGEGMEQLLPLDAEDEEESAELFPMERDEGSVSG